MNDRDSETQANRIAPCATTTVCIDFDGTIVPWGPLDEDRAPFCGVSDALWDLAAQGYRIVILTSRLSQEWWEAEATARGVDAEAFGAEQTEYVTDYMKRWALPYHLITAEKVPALAYFDDRAIRVSEWDHAFITAVGRFLGRTE